MGSSFGYFSWVISWQRMCWMLLDHGGWASGLFNTKTTQQMRSPCLSKYMLIQVTNCGCLSHAHKCSYLSVYAGSLVVDAIVFSAHCLLFLYATLRVSRAIHASLVGSVLGATLR